MLNAEKIDIGQVARASGLPASTLRFYEEKGLIKSSGRHGLRRLYDPGVLEQLSLIALRSLRRIFAERNRRNVFPGRSGPNRPERTQAQSG